MNFIAELLSDQSIVAAMNPCSCGYGGDPAKHFTFAPALMKKYQKRFSGPLIDRIAIHIDVPRGIMKSWAVIE